MKKPTVRCEQCDQFVPFIRQLGQVFVCTCCVGIYTKRMLHALTGKLTT